ncbi:MAG: hypothetical protein ACRBDI_00705 [Alphaproteobacteria bacterium]
MVERAIDVNGFKGSAKDLRYILLRSMCFIVWFAITSVAACSLFWGTKGVLLICFFFLFCIVGPLADLIGNMYVATFLLAIFYIWISYVSISLIIKFFRVEKNKEKSIND